MKMRVKSRITRHRTGRGGGGCCGRWVVTRPQQQARARASPATQQQHCTRAGRALQESSAEYPSEGHTVVQPRPCHGRWHAALGVCTRGAPRPTQLPGSPMPPPPSCRQAESMGWHGCCVVCGTGSHAHASHDPTPPGPRLSTSDLHMRHTPPPGTAPRVRGRATRWSQPATAGHGGVCV